MTECPGCRLRKLNPEFVGEICSCRDAPSAVQCICNLCGCGSDGPGELLIEVLVWCALPSDAKGNEGTYRSAAWELAAKVLDAADLVEHGTGIGWPWITEKGKAFLAWARAIEIREEA